MTVRVYTDVEGSYEQFHDRDGDAYRYSIAAGGALLVIKTPRNSALPESEVEVAYGPTGWNKVEGLEFGDSVLPSPTRD